MSLSNLTQTIIVEWQNDGISRNSLLQYFNYIKRNLKEINAFIDYKDYKHCTLVLGLLLEVDGYLTDPDDRQAVATIAYYIITKGLFTEIYDGNRIGITNSAKSFELTELLGARLSIINDAPQSIKYSLNSSGTIPIDRNWSPFSTSQPVDRTLENMKIYDAYLIDDRRYDPVVGNFINPEIISMAEKILERHSHNSGQDLNMKMMDGYKEHKEFFEYLENRFEEENDFDFS